MLQFSRFRRLSMPTARVTTRLRESLPKMQSKLFHVSGNLARRASRRC